MTIFSIRQSGSWKSNYSSECFRKYHVFSWLYVLSRGPLAKGHTRKTLIERRFSRATANAIKHEWGGKALRAVVLLRSFLIRNIEPECLARNKRRGSSIIHYHLPSIPYFGMLYDPREFTPRNLSDGIDLTRERRNTVLMDYDAALFFCFRYFILYIYIYLFNKFETLFE